MAEISHTCATANATILLVEPATPSRTRRSAELAESPYDVMRAESLREICLMEATLDLSIPILSDAIGALPLRSSAQMVREKWPRARILILGTAPTHLEDYLYDQALRHASDKALFLSTLAMLSPQTSIHAGGTLQAWLESVCSSRPSFRPPPATESDPTKMAVPVMHASRERELPAALHRYLPRR